MCAATDTLESHAPRIPINERLVIICKLGQGASSVVYKALDLVSMRLVALKMVPVFERGEGLALKPSYKEGRIDYFVC